jgi:xylulokinase
MAGRSQLLASAGIGPCLLPADSGGRPLRPAILYGVDTRATAEIDLLTSQFGASSILARGGTALSGRTWRIPGKLAR